jgi:hypothetical protein
MQKDFYGNENYETKSFDVELIKDTSSNVASSSFVFMDQNDLEKNVD